MQYRTGRKLARMLAVVVTLVMAFAMLTPVVALANQQLYSLANDSYIRGRNAGLTNLNSSPNLQRAGTGDNNPRIYLNIHQGNRSLHVTQRTQAWHGFDILTRPLNLRAGDRIQVNGRVSQGTVMQLGGVNNAGNSWPSHVTVAGNNQGQFSLNLTLTQAQINASPDGFRVRTNTGTTQFHVDQIYVIRPNGGGNQPAPPSPSPSPQPPAGGGGGGPREALNFIHNWDSGNPTGTGQRGSGTSRSNLGTATANFNLSTGSVSANWTTARAGNRFNNLHGVGWRHGRHDRVVGYNLGYLNHTSGTQGMTIAAFYGWTRNPMIEWYVIDNWLNHRSTPGVRLGTFTSDGGTYEVWRNTVHGHHINGYGNFIQLKSVRTTPAPIGTNRTITFANHVNAWGRMGQSMGTEWYYQVFLLEGWESNGSGNVTVWPG